MPRSLVSISDLSREEIEALLGLADELLTASARPDRPVGVRGRLTAAEGHVLAALFLEPSTRTRLSFESAMLRLGGHVISSESAASSSAAKGETIADAVRVVEGYADVIVLRHPCDGAARVAAEHAGVPVINAGDGSHEHPTQTLCDLFSLWKERDGLDGLNVMVCGDLKRGRTVHSLMAALGLFGARVIMHPAAGLELPDHFIRLLRAEHGGRIRPVEGLPVPAAGVYEVAGPDGDDTEPLRVDRIDAIYVTRAQSERGERGDAVPAYPVIDATFMSQELYRDSLMLHPLPRVDELAYELDADHRAAYFRQTAYGVPVRMALVAALLELRPGVLGPARGDDDAEPIAGLTCGNQRCITNHVDEQRHLVARFRRLENEAQCVYCDHVAKRVVA